jgi:hypothetical protein
MKNGVQMINDHRPVDTYYNGKKIAGSETKTFSGTSLSIADTYNDYFHELTLTGRYQQSEPSIDNPVYPTFSGDCTLTVGNDEVDIPPLRATDFYADSYNILTGQVETIVDETILTSADGFGVHYRNNFNDVGGVLTYFSAFWLTGQLSTSGYGFCSHLPRYDAEKHGSYFYPTFAESFFYGNASSRRFVMKHSDLGLTTAMTSEEQLAVFKAWVVGENNNGTPIKFWVNRTTPIVTQLTPKTIKTMPYQTNITDNGTLPCNKTATLKVFRRTV